MFYAPNQAMQEYLVDHQEDVKEKETEQKIKRQLPVDHLPVKEITVPLRKTKIRKKEKEGKPLSISFGGIVIAVMLLLVLTSANGQKKIEIFKQVIAETMGNAIEEVPENQIIIEEKRVDDFQEIKEGDDSVILPEYNEKNGKKEKLDITEEEENSMSEKQNIPQEEMIMIQDKETTLQEYIVKEGDTLAAICKKRYGSLSNMQEICTINSIKNADYIAPGQKLYLP